MIGLVRDALEERDFQFVRGLVHARAGIWLGDHKVELVRARLARRVRATRARSLHDYVQALREDPSGTEAAQAVGVIATHLTSFFRGPEQLADLGAVVVPAARARAAAGKRPRTFRVWSAGCSTGEEAYSIAIVLLEAFGAEAPSWRLEVVGTDVAHHVVATARAGVYHDAKVAMIPPEVRARHFERAEASTSRVRRATAQLASFRVESLTQPAALPGAFDAVLCRNVMIYFDAATRDAVLASLVASLVPGGTLYLGQAEGLVRIPAGLSAAFPATYRKRTEA